MATYPLAAEFRGTEVEKMSADLEFVGTTRSGVCFWAARPARAMERDRTVPLLVVAVEVGHLIALGSNLWRRKVVKQVGRVEVHRWG